MIKSNELQEEARSYALYTLTSRAIPALTDGLKAAARRVLWVGRDGGTYKSANLAGASLKYHPHNLPESAINTMAGKYTNNICLLSGEGAFGTRLNMHDGFGAARYTSVRVSAFTKDVVFADIDIIPMKDNYDMTAKEPLHFLPLVPISLVNASEGVATGFASTIYPRDLQEIIEDMIQYLKGKKVHDDRAPYVKALNQRATSKEGRWAFAGKVQISRTQIQVTDLPCDVSHEKFIQHLNKLKEAGTVDSIIDRSSDKIDIRFKLQGAGKLSEQEVMKVLKLEVLISENMTLLNPDHETVRLYTYKQVIEQFTQWRFGFYYQRLDTLIAKLSRERSKHSDIVNAYDGGILDVIKQVESKKELVEFLREINIQEPEPVASLPAYRFIPQHIDEDRAAVNRLTSEINQLQATQKSEEAMKALYVQDLKQILVKYNKGLYDTDFES